MNVDRIGYVVRRGRAALAAVVLVAPLYFAAGAAHAGSDLAPGFTELPKDAQIVIMPIDVELFSLTAGGAAEPRADWTAAALGFMKGALSSKVGRLGLHGTMLDEAAADEFAEQVSLHAAVAQSIALHHAIGGGWKLPTKAGQLNWSFDDAMRPLQQRTGARYGLFVWVRDSYASAERKVAMAAMAILGIGIRGGTQVGYSSLVDLQTGRVLWFNRIQRNKGDLRASAAAADSIDELLSDFPAAE